MKELAALIPPGVLAAFVVGFLLGGVAAFRFARRLERFREAVWQAKNHVRKAADFYAFSREHLGALVAAGLFGVVLAGGVGVLVFVRVTV